MALLVTDLSYLVCIAIQFQHVLTETFNHRDLGRPLSEPLWVGKGGGAQRGLV